MNGDDTIAAIATAPGRGGVAVIRVSGPAAFAVALAITGKEPRVGRVTVSGFRGAAATIDAGIALAFRAPHSYTGEDVVEFQCHGGTVTPRRILEACFAAGARLARHGEFTERAFLNGRLDYEQAASVLDLIDAKTDRAADAALAGLAGRRLRERRALYDALVDLSADVEHALDIDEGELPEDFAATLEGRVSELRARLDGMIRKAHAGKILREGALVVLAGPPNVGKSSLMNALLEENRVLVSDTPGTTRDSVEEMLDLDGWPVRLVDTAGLRTTDDPIEAAGVARAEDLIARADIVLRLVDFSSPARMSGALRNSNRELVIFTKADLAPGGLAASSAASALCVSSRTGAGLDALKRTIADVLEHLAPREDASEPDLAPLLRVRSLLPDACADLVLAGNALRAASEVLGEALGVTYSEDMLDRLFSRFCVGK